jgi:hypothetical protein
LNGSRSGGQAEKLNEATEVEDEQADRAAFPELTINRYLQILQAMPSPLTGALM